jgi:hypothetical protein
LGLVTPRPTLLHQSVTAELSVVQCHTATPSERVVRHFQNIEVFMSRMDDFNRIVVLVLGKAFESFPQPVHIYAKDITELPDNIVDEETARTFDATVQFLASEGFLKYEGESDEGLFFNEVSLTLKSLKILNSIPSSIDEKKNIGQKFSELAKSGAKEASKELIKKAVEQLTSMAFLEQLKSMIEKMS